MCGAPHTFSPRSSLGTLQVLLAALFLVRWSCTCADARTQTGSGSQNTNEPHRLPPLQSLVPAAAWLDLRRPRSERAPSPSRMLYQAFWTFLRRERGCRRRRSLPAPALRGRRTVLAAAHRSPRCQRRQRTETQRCPGTLSAGPAAP